MNINNYPLWTAVITPMKDNGDVDYPTLEKLLRQQEEAKNGLLILGSTGESLNLDLDEKKEILKFSLGLDLTVPVMVGVGGVNLKTTTAWVEHLETLKIDCYLMVVPLYAKPNAEGQYQWFKTLMDKATRPVMLYNIPGRTGKPLEHAALERLKDHKNFWAIKEASGSEKEFAAFQKVAPDARMYSGDDPMLPAYVPHGAVGLVSVASNPWPAATHRYVDKALAGELTDTEKALWKECSESLFVAGNPVTVKKLMRATGTIPSDVCRPPLSNAEKCDESVLLASESKINEWFKG